MLVVFCVGGVWLVVFDARGVALDTIDTKTHLFRVCDGLACYCMRVVCFFWELILRV